MLQFGDIVLFGRAAKLLDVPTLSAVKAPTLAQAPVVFNNVPPEAAVEGPADTGDKEQQELMLQLQKLDEQMGKVGSNEVASVRYQLQRAEVMEKLAERAKTDEDRIEWLRQQADCLIGAIQMSGAKEPQERLAKFLESLRGADQGSSLAGYVAFRQISANYFRKLQAAGSDFTAVQKEWLEDLEKFVSDYPDGEDTADALSQLAIGLEFTGKEDAACERYQRIVDAFPKSGVAARARGAIERLGLVGKPFKLRAPDIRRGTVDVDRLAGKVVLIDYWATTCDPWKSELARLKEIYNKYKGKGFEIIGVSLDSDKAEVMKYVQSAGIPWPVVYEPGGLDSTLALQYGILALPTQFLVDAKGQVVSRTVHITMLEDELTKLLAK
jgi:TolA-binding protein/peroxiredoxin